MTFADLWTGYLWPLIIIVAQSLLLLVLLLVSIRTSLVVAIVLSITIASIVAHAHKFVGRAEYWRPVSSCTARRFEPRPELGVGNVAQIPG